MGHPPIPVKTAKGQETFQQAIAKEETLARSSRQRRGWTALASKGWKNLWPPNNTGAARPPPALAGVV